MAATLRPAKMGPSHGIVRKRAHKRSSPALPIVTRLAPIVLIAHAIGKIATPNAMLAVFASHEMNESDHVSPKAPRI